MQTCSTHRVQILRKLKSKNGSSRGVEGLHPENASKNRRLDVIPGIYYCDYCLQAMSNAMGRLYTGPLALAVCQ